MPRRSPRRVALALAVATACVGAVAPAAQASTRAFDVRSAQKISSGRAVATGKLVFSGPRTVRIDGRIDDECDGQGQGDGYGAYVRFRFELSGGGYRVRTVKDVRGCTPGARRVRFTMRMPTDIISGSVTVNELDERADGTHAADYASASFLP